MRVVVDCAHGATCRVAPRLLRALGADVVTMGVRPSGTNINAGAGALHPERLQARVRELGGAIGLAFDGDGDRLMTVDESGEVRDGDHLLAIFAGALRARGELRGGVVVSTVMANLGLERALAALGIGMARTAVGDRYVLEEMLRRGANLGGEQSGHIIFLDHATTGDGLLSGLAAPPDPAGERAAAGGAGRVGHEVPAGARQRRRPGQARAEYASGRGASRGRLGGRSSRAERGSSCGTREPSRSHASWWRETIR